MTTQTLTIDRNKTELADVVRAAQAGDRAAFGELVVRFQQNVYATALRRLRDHGEAEELAQEVFVKALEKLHQLETPEAFGGWLRQITVRMAINRCVRRAPTIATEPQTLAATCAEEATPLTHALADERKREVRAGMGRLAKLDRDTLNAFYFRGRSIVEMSEEFRSPVGTIKRRLHVARRRLAKELESLAV